MSWKDRLLEVLGLGRAPSVPGAPVPVAGATKARRRVTAVIGLDFGTSCTKCVIGAAGRATAVPFKDLTSPDTPYLLPTQLWLGKDRSLSLLQSGGALSISGIKVGLMTNPDGFRALGGGREATPVMLAAAYLGEVIRYAQGWFLAEKAALLGNSDVAWQLNVGLPAKSHDDQEIQDAFRRAVHAAWALSQRQGMPNLGLSTEVVRAVSESAYSLTGISIDAVNLVPEVAAEVVGYARSAQKREGPHLMVDVGATTVDVCLFHLAQAAEGFSYAFYATDVRSDLGAFRLHSRRRAAIDPSATDLGLNSPLEPIPFSYKSYSGANDAAREIDTWFGAETEKTVRTVAVRAKQKQRSGLVVEVEKQRGIERVKEGEIRVLMCGGGSTIPVYMDAVRAAGRELAPGGKTGQRLKPFGIVPGLEYPARLDAPGLRRADFHRVAVAYGLSFSVDNIGRFSPPSEIEPEPRWWLADFEDRRPEND